MHENLSESEKKRRRKEALKKYDSTKVAIGKDNIGQWRELRSKLGGDTQIARHLLLLHQNCTSCNTSQPVATGSTVLNLKYFFISLPYPFTAKINIVKF